MTRFSTLGEGPFASGIKTAMATPFGEDAEEVCKTLAKHGVSSRLAEQVVPSTLKSKRD